MSFVPIEPRESREEIAQLSRHHLEQVVRVDSQSDENSSTIPSTPSQAKLAEQVAAFFRERGAEVDRDEHANVVARFPGRGAGADRAPMALLVHLDTSRGTRAVDKLHVHESWEGEPIPYPENPDLSVGGDTYPAVAEFLGHDIVHGPGRAPFGLDDKLGLAHLMTLSMLLGSNPEIAHPPLFLIGRPDEEIGRMEAVHGLAALLAERGVRFGYTVDGILPFEVNIENFNASNVAVVFASRALETTPSPRAKQLEIFLGGVNTHGATAHAEGHRNANRFATEVIARLDAAGLVPDRIVPLRHVTDSHRECDAVWTLLLDGPDDDAIADNVQRVKDVLEEVVGQHTSRGASWKVGSPTAHADDVVVDGSALHVLRFLGSFVQSNPGFVLLAEDSAGRQGYTHPYRVRPVDAGIQVEFRVRDFEASGLEARQEHVRELASRHGAAAVEVMPQYVNMGPRMAPHLELIDWAKQAGQALGLEVRVQPIRGGTGVDPFLDRGVPVGNLGTGYFAPESEKEFTSLQMMAQHALWLTALVQVVAHESPAT
jgi:tripeptide aminopeptidase